MWWWPTVKMSMAPVDPHDAGFARRYPGRSGDGGIVHRRWLAFVDADDSPFSRLSGRAGGDPFAAAATAASPYAEPGGDHHRVDHRAAWPVGSGHAGADRRGRICASKRIGTITMCGLKAPGPSLCRWRSRQTWTDRLADIEQLPSAERAPSRAQDGMTIVMPRHAQIAAPKPGLAAAAGLAPRGGWPYGVKHWLRIHSAARQYLLLIHMPRGRAT